MFMRWESARSICLSISLVWCALSRVKKDVTHWKMSNSFIVYEKGSMRLCTYFSLSLSFSLTSILDQSYPTVICLWIIYSNPNFDKTHSPNSARISHIITHCHCHARHYVRKQIGVESVVLNFSLCDVSAFVNYDDSWPYCTATLTNEYLFSLYAPVSSP